MADLLAKQKPQPLNVTRGQELTGEVISITPYDITVDLGTKAEGVLYKKDVASSQVENLKVGDKIQVFVVHPENESGQVVLALQRAQKSVGNPQKWVRVEEALRKGTILQGKGVEINRGGLVVEVSGMRGFVPSSQLSLAKAANPDALIGQTLGLRVLEVDPAANRLILSEQYTVSEDVLKKLKEFKEGSKVSGTISAILPFGIAVNLKDGVEGFVHIADLSWERTEDIAQKFTVDQEIEAQVLSVDESTGRVNLSLKALESDPFDKIAADYQIDDVVKGTVSKVNESGVYITLKEGIEGVMPQANLEAGSSYEVGQELTVIIDKVDVAKRRITLSPFITSTAGLIYK
jgi:ribosomal protein S1